MKRPRMNYLATSAEMESSFFIVNYLQSCIVEWVQTCCVGWSRLLTTPESSHPTFQLEQQLLSKWLLLSSKEASLGNVRPARFYLFISAFARRVAQATWPRVPHSWNVYSLSLKNDPSRTCRLCYRSIRRSHVHTPTCTCVRLSGSPDPHRAWRQNRG